MYNDDIQKKKITFSVADICVLVIAGSFALEIKQRNDDEYQQDGDIPAAISREFYGV